MNTVSVCLFAVCAVTVINLVSGGAIFCEDSKGYIQCPPDQKIAVYDAYYGRKHDAKVCPHSHTSNRRCRAAGSFTKIKRACNNKQICFLWASNGVYGDPCVGTYKYIEVDFSCVEA